MEELQLAYKGEFTIEQRKIMTAEALQELRKARKLSQKEVAAHLNIPATTYNTYESGRTEPPIEILVRLSHLYGMPIDIIVQRDRTYTTAEDVGQKMAAFKEELAELDKQIAKTFSHTRLLPARATSGKHLIELINSGSSDIITSIIHFFT